MQFLGEVIVSALNTSTVNYVHCWETEKTEKNCDAVLNRETAISCSRVSQEA